MMKKMLSLGLVLGTLFITSCTSDEQKEGIEGSQTIHKVRIVASGFSEAISPITKNAESTIKDNISRLRYFVYDGQGKMAAMQTQNKRINNSPALPPDPFGALDLDLPSGKYTLVVLGEEKNENGNYGNFEISSAHKLNTLRMPYTSIPNQVGDLFLKIQTLDITNENIQVPIRLDRVVGQASININESIPAATAKIDIAVVGEGWMYYFGEDRIDHIINNAITHSFEITADEVGSFFSKNIHILNTEKPVTIRVTAINSAGEVIAARIINNIKISKNKRTVLTSTDFFTADPAEPIPNKIEVNIDPSWGVSSINEELK